MKRYYDPELEIVSFETADVTNFGEGDNPDVPGDELSGTDGSKFLPEW